MKGERLDIDELLAESEANRPDETVAQRLAWLDIETDDDTPIEAVDYRGQRVRDVIADCLNPYPPIDTSGA